MSLLVFKNMTFMKTQLKQYRIEQESRDVRLTLYLVKINCQFNNHTIKPVNTDELY